MFPKFWLKHVSSEQEGTSKYMRYIIHELKICMNFALLQNLVGMSINYNLSYIDSTKPRGHTLYDN